MRALRRGTCRDSTTHVHLTSYASFHLHYGVVEPGTTVADRFEIRSLVQADVFRARDRVTGADVALKIVRDGSDRFAREIDVIAKLDDPRIVRHVAHGKLPSGDAFVALEWLDAETLWDRLKVGFTARRAVEVGAAIARALAAVHARGVVHRDLAPSSVVLTRAGDVKLVDFGLAWAPDGAALTQTGDVIGTLGYIAPEQLSAEERVDARADLFGLGCLLYLMLTGQPAFHAETLMSLQARIMFEEPIDVRDRVPAIPEALGELVRELLAKEPAARPATALVVAEQLEAIAPTLDDAVLRPHHDATAAPAGAVVRGAEITALVGGSALLDTHASEQTEALSAQPATPAHPTPLALEETASSLVDMPDDTAAEIELVTKSTKRYELKGVIGQGGLGRVMLAHDRELDRPVAIKELLRRTPINSERFKREALVTARLQHPNIVPVHDAGRWPNGSPFYAMKLVEGVDLTKLIERKRDLDDRLALLPKVIAVCEAMAYAHDRRIIHRDLKPSNVVIGEFGEALIVDWGLAKDLDAEDTTVAEDSMYRAAAGPELTRAGDILGTPAYMAPEQARGEHVDERTDVYALGAILYHLLAGHAPYADMGETTAKVLTGEPPNPVDDRAPEAPAELLAITRKAMARDPGDRYGSALELARELRRFEAGQLVSAHRYSLGDIVRRWVRKHRTALAVAAVLVTALLVVGAYALYRVLEAEQVARAERELAVVGHQRAHAESLRLRVLQAEEALARDPTEAAAWLAIDDALPAELHARAVAVATTAASRGVAHTVHRLRGRVIGIDAQSDRVAVLSASGELAVWTRNGDEVFRHAVPGPAYGIALSRDGGQLVVTTADGKVRWWRSLAAAPRELQLPALADRAVFLGDATVAVTSADGVLTLWPATGEPDKHQVHGGPIHALLAIGGDALTVAGDGDLVRTGVDGIRWRVRAHDGGANHVDAAADDRVVTCGEDGAIRVWRVTDGSKLAETTTGGPLYTVAAHGDDVIAAATGKTVHRWRITAPAATSEPVTIAGRAAVARAGLQIVGLGPTVRIYRGDATHVLSGHRDMIEHIAVPADGELVTTDRTGAVRFWRLPATARVIPGGVSTAPVRAPRGWLVGDQTGAVLEVTPDGERRELFRVDGRIAAVRATADATTIAIIAGKRTLVRRGDALVELAIPSPVEIALSADGTHLAALTGNEVQVWRTDGTRLRSEPATQNVLAFHGSRVLWAHPVRGLASLDLANPAGAPAITGDFNVARAIAFGDTVAIASKTGRVEIISAQGWSIAARDFDLDVFSLGATPTELLVGDADGRVHAWSWKSGAVRTWRGHDRWVHGIDIPDGSGLATSWNRSSLEVRVWRIADGATQSLVVPTPASLLYGAALDATASRLAIADKNGALVLATLPRPTAIGPGELGAWSRQATRMQLRE